MTQLKGITWGHSRGITPLLAYSQRFSELHPDVEVIWTKRTLQEFADYPLEKLASQYDLLIIDHPWVGTASAVGCVLPLDEYIDADFLSDQAANSVGNSHQSYYFRGHQWALAIDAATPAASYRPDLLKKANISLPKTWKDLLQLADRGLVAVPGIPVDLLMNFYMFCIANGSKPFKSSKQIVAPEIGILALQSMQELYSRVDPLMFNSNPIAVAEMMTSTDKYYYCPFAYCYSNYAREGYAKRRLTYGELVEFDGQSLRSTLGGTGIAVSSSTSHTDIAIEFVKGIMSPAIQSGLYVENGGQAGHRSAWRGKLPNLITHDFFLTLLPVLDNAYTRPRYNGYLQFQDEGGDHIRECLMHGGNPDEVLAELNSIYKRSLTVSQSILH